MDSRGRAVRDSALLGHSSSTRSSPGAGIRQPGASADAPGGQEPGRAGRDMSAALNGRAASAEGGRPGDGTVQDFPKRPGQPVCEFFAKTGHCKFGSVCKFDHPPRFAVRLNKSGLPMREGLDICSHYARTGTCKFGASCKFHHPNPAASNEEMALWPGTTAPPRAPQTDFPRPILS